MDLLWILGPGIFSSCIPAWGMKVTQEKSVIWLFFETNLKTTIIKALNETCSLLVLLDM